MLPSDLKSIAMALPDTSESTPFAPDRVVYKLASKNKVFAILSGHEAPVPMVTLKMPPEEVTALLQKFPTILPAYKQNKKYWLTAPLEGEVPDELLRELVVQSYTMVKAKASGTKPTG
jgi:predicted DNA-binding protein (MmcQ/YjbR family)